MSEQTEKNKGYYKNGGTVFKNDIGHTIGAVSRYDQEYLKYYIPDVNVEVNLGLFCFVSYCYHK